MHKLGVGGRQLSADQRYTFIGATDIIILLDLQLRQLTWQAKQKVLRLRMQFLIELFLARQQKYFLNFSSSINNPKYNTYVRNREDVTFEFIPGFIISTGKY